MDFAPLDELEDSMLGLLRSRYRRVSVERIVSGPGLANIHETLARIEGLPIRMQDDASLWKSALEGSDSLAVARSEEHTSELQSLMRTSYAVFCLKKKNTHN